MTMYGSGLVGNTLKIKIYKDYCIINNKIYYRHGKNNLSNTRGIFKLSNTEIIKIDLLNITKFDKFSYKNWLYRQTEKEIKLYSKITKNDLKYFPKILDSGYCIFNNIKIYWAIQKLIKIKIPKYFSVPHARIISRLAKKYKIEDIEFYTKNTKDRLNYKVNTNCGIDLDTQLPIIFDYGIAEGN